MSLKIPGYSPAIATEGVKETKITRSGSVILIDPLIKFQLLKERTRGKTELIGVKIVGDSERTYDDPFELWTTYIGPYSPEIIGFTNMLKELNKERKNRALLAGDMNTKYQPLNRDQTHTRGSKRLLELLEKLEDEGEATILNNFGESTTKHQTTIDLAVALGRWEEGFAHPVIIDLGSNHYPVCIGIKIQENRAARTEYIDMPKHNRSKHEEVRIVNKCAEIDNDIKNYNANSLAQEILNIYKPARLPQTKKNKRKKNIGGTNTWIKNSKKN